MRFGLTSLVNLAGLLSSLAIKDECRKNDRPTQTAYNHEQKSWDKFGFFFLSKQTSPTPRPPQNNVGLAYPEFFLSITFKKLEGGRTAEYFAKDGPVL